MEASKQVPALRARDWSGNKLEVDANDDLAIGRDLDKEMSEQPGLYAHYAGLHSASEARLRTLKKRIHDLKEELDEEVRKEAADSESKKPTEAEIKNRINRDSRMRKLYAAQTTEENRMGHLKVLREAMAQRKDMLTSLGRKRQEDWHGSTEVTTRKLQQKARSKRSKHEER